MVPLPLSRLIWSLLCPQGIQRWDVSNLNLGFETWRHSSGKELNGAPRVVTDIGGVPVQMESKMTLMNVISESVKLVMEQDPLCPFVLGGDEKLGRPEGILHLDDPLPDIYSAFEVKGGVRAEGETKAKAKPFLFRYQIMWTSLQRIFCDAALHVFNSVHQKLHYVRPK